MRTNVALDDKLMELALKHSGLKTKKAAIEEGLRLLVQLNLMGKEVALQSAANYRLLRKKKAHHQKNNRCDHRHCMCVPRLDPPAQR